ncbi:hypothetical protein AYI68_g6490 [Smittium mucronatum]|uniref:Uncharacterized protein n=1 Tax=Smittium mucronatum TaxID=133383 RepID=A0A1R0GRD5_9FUNG|nr:hypothetical protein AYI68_g6490 [Smittium mucronatum]
MHSSDTFQDIKYDFLYDIDFGKKEINSATTKIEFKLIKTVRSIKIFGFQLNVKNTNIKVSVSKNGESNEASGECRDGQWKKKCGVKFKNHVVGNYTEIYNSNALNFEPNEYRIEINYPKGISTTYFSKKGLLLVTSIKAEKNPFDTKAKKTTPNDVFFPVLEDGNLFATFSLSVKETKYKDSDKLALISNFNDYDIVSESFFKKDRNVRGLKKTGSNSKPIEWGRENIDPLLVNKFFFMFGELDWEEKTLNISSKKSIKHLEFYKNGISKYISRQIYLIDDVLKYLSVKYGKSIALNALVDVNLDDTYVSEIYGIMFNENDISVWKENIVRKIIRMWLGKPFYGPKRVNNWVEVGLVEFLTQQYIDSKIKYIQDFKPDEFPNVDFLYHEDINTDFYDTLHNIDLNKVSIDYPYCIREKIHSNAIKSYRIINAVHGILGNDRFTESVKQIFDYYNDEKNEKDYEKSLKIFEIFNKNCAENPALKELIDINKWGENIGQPILNAVGSSNRRITVTQGRYLNGDYNKEVESPIPIPISIEFKGCKSHDYQLVKSRSSNLDFADDFYGWYLLKTLDHYFWVNYDIENLIKLANDQELQNSDLIGTSNVISNTFNLAKHGHRKIGDLLTFLNSFTEKTHPLVINQIIKQYYTFFLVNLEELKSDGFKKMSISILGKFKDKILCNAKNEYDEYKGVREIFLEIILLSGYQIECRKYANSSIQTWVLETEKLINNITPHNYKKLMTDFNESDPFSDNDTEENVKKINLGLFYAVDEDFEEFFNFCKFKDCSFYDYKTYLILSREKNFQAAKDTFSSEIKKDIGYFDLLHCSVYFANFKEQNANENNLLVILNNFLQVMSNDGCNPYKYWILNIFENIKWRDSAKGELDIYLQDFK